MTKDITMNKIVPVIDFQPFFDGNTEEKEAVAKQIYEAFDQVGCIYLKNYGFSPDLVNKAFAQSQAFFCSTTRRETKNCHEQDEPRI